MQVLIQTFTVWLIATVVALLVALIIKAIVALLGRQVAHPAPAAGTPAALGTGDRPMSDADDTPPPHHVAAIAAALSVALDEPQIVHIETARQGSGWTAEGRSAHRASHDTGRGSRSTRH